FSTKIAFSTHACVGREMMNEISNEAKTLELGKLLGQRKAFGLMAGRCSAAHAATLRAIRDGKAYESIASSWGEFCERDLHISASQANRIIKYLDELGPAYFELAHLTPISPREYRSLAPVIVDHRLEVDGKSIALIAEKADEVTAAVVELRRKSGESKPPAGAVDRMGALKRQCEKLATEMESARRKAQGAEGRQLLNLIATHISRVQQVAGRL